MPQRNGQNPIRKFNNFGKDGNKPNDSTLNSNGKTSGGTGICPACKTEVPPKPGFRFSSLKCPKCGASMGKK
ncbi:MAG: hypothetical protein ACYC5N_08835 [Endomicrobiales bacterium]